MSTLRLTTAQALVRFLAAQRHVDDHGDAAPLVAGCLGIFGHGNLAGIGQALQQYHGTESGLRYVQARNEQAMVHTAIAYARHMRRSRVWACTASVGPGSTNMVTGAATATINRIPVLLLPGDTFATRSADPVLQQLEHPSGPDISVNDCLRPVSRFFDRITRPEQLPSTLLEAMRVLTDPAETGAVTIALPQDVQAEAFDWPERLFEVREWRTELRLPSPAQLDELVTLLRAARRPVIVAGGGVRYSDAAMQLAAFATLTGMPVVETQAGKGVLPTGHPNNLGAVGATGAPAANRVLREADLVVGLGTRWSDFTTASRTAFSHDAQIVSVNVNAFDAAKLGGRPVVADVAAALEVAWGELGYQVRVVGGELVLDQSVPPLVDDEWREHVSSLRQQWIAELDSMTAPDPAHEAGKPLAQREVIGAVNRAARDAEQAGRGATVVCAAGSLPGDLHKLWRTIDSQGYHVEYGYSCMGYEVAGGLGVALADPGRDVFVMVGDGSWLMMGSEVVTAVQEGVAFTIVLVDNHGFGSIGSLSESLGSAGFGTRYRHRTGDGTPGGDGGFSGSVLTLDHCAIARGMGANATRAASIAELEQALADARSVTDRPTVIVVECDPALRPVPGYDSWWDVPVAEVSQMPSVRAARSSWEQARTARRPLA